MRIAKECIPCLARQAIDIAQEITSDTTQQELIIKGCLNELAQINFSESAPQIAHAMHQVAKGITGILDPYQTLKATFNEVALALVDELRVDPRVANSAKPFDTACRLAIAGNIIDFSVGIDVTAEDIAKSVEDCLSANLFGAGSVALERAALQAKSILYLADNAGEIVFDRLLIEALPTHKVTVVVKGGPIVNDATFEDALLAGLPALVNVIDNGYNAQGTILHKCSPEFQNLFYHADLVISKGQANYETLSDLPSDASKPNQRRFFLMRAKCQSVAHALGCEKMAFVLDET